MTEPFPISVSLHGEEKTFITRWQPFGYTHRFIVEVNGLEVYFEPDEEGAYRAIAAPGQDEKAVKALPADWLEAIGQTLQEA